MSSKRFAIDVADSCGEPRRPTDVHGAQRASDFDLRFARLRWWSPGGGHIYVSLKNRPRARPALLLRLHSLVAVSCLLYVLCVNLARFNLEPVAVQNDNETRRARRLMLMSHVYSELSPDLPLCRALTRSLAVHR